MQLYKVHTEEKREEVHYAGGEASQLVVLYTKCGIKMFDTTRWYWARGMEVTCFICLVKGAILAEEGYVIS